MPVMILGINLYMQGWGVINKSIRDIFGWFTLALGVVLLCIAALVYVASPEIELYLKIFMCLSAFSMLFITIYTSVKKVRIA
jgi:hypothetical protein